jgi:hypothetical protein
MALGGSLAVCFGGQALRNSTDGRITRIWSLPLRGLDGADFGYEVKVLRSTGVAAGSGSLAHPHDHESRSNMTQSRYIVILT